MDDLQLSPEFVAANSIPHGVERFKITDNAQWHGLRSHDVTASVIGALFGANEYETEFSLWAKKSGKISADVEETSAMERGNLLEPVAVELLRKRYPEWKFFYPVGYYYRDTDYRIGCTPDVFAIDPSRPGFGNIQIKNPEAGIYREKWFPNGRSEPPVPPDAYSIQTTIENSLTGASWGAVAAFRTGHGCYIDLIDVPIHSGLVTKARKLSLAFWKRIEDNDPPPMNYAKDASVISALYPEGNEAITIDLSKDNRIMELVSQREVLKARESDGAAAKKEREIIDSEVKAKLGSAAFGLLSDGRRIEAKTTRRKAYVAKESIFRTIKVTGDVE